MGVQKGQLVELEVGAAAFEGTAVARIENFVIFVRDAVPGDRVRALIRRKKSKFAEATVEELLRPSPQRVEPRCEYFGTCGGCRWQNADYRFQLEFKAQQVRDLMSRIGELPELEIPPALPSPRQFFYRNKMEFTFGASRWLSSAEIDSGAPLERDFALGLHIPKRFDKILDLERCYLQGPPSSEIVNLVRSIARREAWTAYDTIRHTGYLRNLVIRNSEYGGEILVNLVTSQYQPECVSLLCSEILSQFPAVTTFINSVNSGRSPVAAGEEYVIYGPGQIFESIGSLRFAVSPTTFFQPNTLQAERLYGIVEEMAGLGGGEVLYDLYSGVGCIALFLAGKANRVVGIEENSRSVEDAWENARLNGVDNSVFFAVDAAAALHPEFVDREGHPDVLVVDPPRVGLAQSLCAQILEIRPRRIVYVSCNPATQARDLKILSSGYEVARMQPVDMFPNTYHIENVALMVRR